MEQKRKTREGLQKDEELRKVREELERQQRHKQKQQLLEQQKLQIYERSEKQKRQREEQRTDSSSVQFRQQPSVGKISNCKSCQKSYPLNYLSKLT